MPSRPKLHIQFYTLNLTLMWLKPKYLQKFTLTIWSDNNNFYWSQSSLFNLLTMNQVRLGWTFPLWLLSTPTTVCIFVVKYKVMNVKIKLDCNQPRGKEGRSFITIFLILYLLFMKILYTLLWLGCNDLTDMYFTLLLTK